jgi:hypothetical protein
MTPGSPTLANCPQVDTLHLRNPGVSRAGPTADLQSPWTRQHPTACSVNPRIRLCYASPGNGHIASYSQKNNKNHYRDVSWCFSLLIDNFSGDGTVSSLEFLHMAPRGVCTQKKHQRHSTLELLPMERRCHRRRCGADRCFANFGFRSSVSNVRVSSRVKQISKLKVGICFPANSGEKKNQHLKISQSISDSRPI